MSMPLLSCANLHKTYSLGRVNVPVLRGVSMDVHEGEWVTVLGASGSGKSTLLHLLGGLDRPDKGPDSSLVFDGQQLVGAGGRTLDRHRTDSVGFVFQFYHLLPELTVLENVAIGSMVSGKGGSASRDAAELLDGVGLSHRLKHRPTELSGGERQRVAIARALVNQPRVLLADEPTGNLDRVTGESIQEMLASLKRERSLTLVMVTHDERVADRSDRVLRLEDGCFSSRASDVPSEKQAEVS